MPVIRTQFNLAAGQWPGPGNEGIVSFAHFDTLPRNSRVRLHRVAWFANAPAGGGAVAPAGSVVTFRFDHPTDASSRIILLDAQANDPVTTPARYDDTASVDLCPTIVPRELRQGDLQHYTLEVVSTGLVGGGGALTTLMVDWDLEPWPDFGPGALGAVR